MRTTVVLRDDLVRRARARAALRGQPLDRYIEQSLEHALNADEKSESGKGDWIKRLPKLSPEASADLKAALDREDLREIDPEMWK